MKRVLLKLSGEALAGYVFTKSVFRFGPETVMKPRNVWKKIWWMSPWCANRLTWSSMTVFF